MRHLFTILLILSFITGVSAQKEVNLEEVKRVENQIRPSNYRSGQGLVMDTLFPPIFNEDCANTVVSFEPTGGWGYVAGTNNFEDQEKAQKFEFNESSSFSVLEVGVFFSNASVVGDGPLRVKVYGLDERTGGPGELLGTSDDIKVSDILLSGENLLTTLFTFSTPAPVEGNCFFASVDFSDLYESNDTVGIFLSDIGCGSGEDAWELFGGQWAKLFDSWGGLDSDLFMAAIVDYQESTSTEDITEKLGLKIYPSPANDVINISYNLNTSDFINVEIFSIEGKRLKTLPGAERSSGFQQINLDVSDLNNGYYLTRITTEEGTATKSFIISK